MFWVSRAAWRPPMGWTDYDLPGGCCLALFCTPRPNTRCRPGGASVAFAVADLGALNARLAAAGVNYTGDMTHGPSRRMSSVDLHQLTRTK